MLGMFTRVCPSLGRNSHIVLGFIRSRGIADIGKGGTLHDRLSCHAWLDRGPGRGRLVPLMESLSMERRRDIFVTNTKRAKRSMRLSNVSLGSQAIVFLKYA